MGEEKKEGGGEKKEEKQEDGNKSAGEEKKKEGEEETQTPEIVVKVDMHCEACARKVARALKGFQGVENVTTDCKGGKVVVKGKEADPAKVCHRIQKKTGRKVELISPLPKPPPPPDQEEKKPDESNPKPPPPEHKKPEPPAVVTVVLKVRMHCDACAQVLQKRIRKIQGVESVTTDLANNQVIVKGIIDDPEKLATDVYKKTGKQATVVKEEEKKEEEKKDEEKKKEEEEKKKADDQEKKSEEEEKKNDDMKKNEYWPHPSRYYYMQEYAAYPPQMFSDENPNACIVM